MNRFAVAKLEANTYFDSPVYLEDQYIILTPDTPVTEDLINRLNDWKYEEVCTDGSPSEKPFEAVPSEDAVEDEAIDEESVENIAKHDLTFYLHLVEYIEETLKSFVASGQLDAAQMTQKVKEIIDWLKQDKDRALSTIAVVPPIDNYVLTHSVSCCLLSLAIGETLRLPPHRLIELGMAALLHDVGMAKIPSTLYQSSKKLTEKERKTVMAHTILGYRLLKAVSVTENVALAALEHQERMNGSGYPKRLTGDVISIFARVVAVASTYEAMVAHRPYKESINGHRALLTMLKTNRSGYDEKVLMALVYNLSLYPLGLSVQLSNGVKGVVYKTNAKNPREPVVLLAETAKGQKPKENENILVPLSKEKNITVVKVLPHHTS